MSIVLFSGGGIGLSNNGDFGRVMGSNSLEFAQEPELFVYEDTYRMKLQGDSPGEQLWNLLFSTEKIEAYPSIHMVFVRASLVGNLAVNLVTGQSMDTYHIQVLGVIYLLCYAGLLLLLFSSFRLPNLGCDLLVKVAIILSCVTRAMWPILIRCTASRCRCWGCWLWRCSPCGFL